MTPHPIPSRAGNCTATSSLPASASAATHPGGAHVAGGFSGEAMTSEREAHLIRMARTLRCTGQIEGFRAQLREQSEALTGALMAALVERERAK